MCPRRHHVSGCEGIVRHRRGTALRVRPTRMLLALISTHRLRGQRYRRCKRCHRWSVEFHGDGLSNPNGYIGIGSFNVFDGVITALVGAGTAATSAYAGAIVRATVTQINWTASRPINLPPANASVGFNSRRIRESFSLGAWVSASISRCVAAGQVATKVEVSIDNQLIAISEPASFLHCQEGLPN